MNVSKNNTYVVGINQTGEVSNRIEKQTKIKSYISYTFEPLIVILQA
jgi:hypothetical protein